MPHATATCPPQTLHGLPVYSPLEAHERGFRSITTAISSETEKTILANVAANRDPDRACLILTSGSTIFELATRR